MPDRAAIVTALILERPLCDACIATKSGFSATDLDATVAVLRAVLMVHDEIGRCRACNAVKRVLSVDRPAR